MRSLSASLCASLGVALMMFSSSQAASVELKGSHLCCGACYKAVDKAVAGVKGATVTTDKKAKTITVKAADANVVQKALDALAAAGFHGRTGNKKIAIKDDSGVKAGKVKRLALTGVHNCCGGCNKAIKKAIESVSGVVANTAKPRSKDVVIEGEFDGAAVVKALNKAGFHVTAQKKD